MSDAGGEAKRMRVVHAYAASAENELSLQPGDIVTVVEEDNNGWHLGRLNGKEAFFPSNYCEPYTEPKAPLSPAPSVTVTPSTPGSSNKKSAPASPRVSTHDEAVPRKNSILGPRDETLSRRSVESPSPRTGRPRPLSFHGRNPKGSLRGGDSPASDKGTPTASPGTLRKNDKSPGSTKKPEKEDATLNTIGKKAAELLFRRKERKEQKKRKDDERAAGNETVSWPAVGRVVVPVGPGSDAAAAASSVPAGSTSPPVLPQKPKKAEEKSDESHTPREVRFASDSVDGGTEEVTVEPLELELPAPAEGRGDESGEELEKIRTEMQQSVEELRRQVRRHEEQFRQELAQERSRARSAEAAKEEALAQLRRELEEARLAAAQSSLENEQSKRDNESISQAEVQILNDALERTNSELTSLRLEFEAMEATSMAAETVHQQEKSQLEMELQLRGETVERQKQRMDVLNEEKLVNRKTIKELNEELEKQLQYVFSESAKIEQLEGELAQMAEDKGRAEATAAARAGEVATLTAVCEGQKQRIEELVGRTDQDAVQLTQLRSEVETLRGLLKTSTVQLETLRSDTAAEEARTRTALEQKNAELAEVTARSVKEIERLKRGVDAISSGRGRLEQLQELQNKLDENEERWEQERTQLEEKIAALSAENESLAESNQQLITALEEGGEGVGLTKMETREWEARCAQLESSLSDKTADLDKLKQYAEMLRAELAASQTDAADKSAKVATAIQRMKAMRTEYELLAAAMASAKQSAEVIEAEHRAQAAKAAQRHTELEGRHAELTDKAAALEGKLKEAGEAYAELDKEKGRLVAELEERAGEIGAIRERLNEAIQERWLTEGKMAKMQKDAERADKGGAVGPQRSTADIEFRERELTRKIQDLEGDVKRARTELQEQKVKLGEAIRDRQEETSKMQSAMKQMATQIVELEEDLRYSEEHCEEYEALVQTLRDELEARPAK